METIGLRDGTDTEDEIEIDASNVRMGEALKYSKSTCQANIP